MAYETQTYEVILKRMIDRVTAKYPNLDNREGSIIFDALAPAAIELAIMYVELDNAMKESFVETATREYILKGCEQMGMDTSVFAASRGIHKGVFNIPVAIGSRWSCDIYNYTVSEEIDKEGELYAYRLECDTYGTAPNNQTGTLIPITENPQDLTSAELVGVLIEGENETPDDEVREAYFEYVNSVATDGNVAQYKRWCANYDGIGHARVFALPDGVPNTVKVSILSESNTKASDELIEEFQNYLDPGIKGMGDGVAPIGAFVTVTTATEMPINVSGTIKLANGYSEEEVKTNITNVLTKYFSELAYTKSQVPYMNVGATILSAEGVDFIADLTIGYFNEDLNIEVSGITDIYLDDEVIPVVGTQTWTVSN